MYLHNRTWSALVEGFNANKGLFHRQIDANEIIDVINFQFIYLSSLSVKLKNDERIHRSQLKMMEHRIVKVCTI